jgi:hypothetical protein
LTIRQSFIITWLSEAPLQIDTLPNDSHDALGATLHGLPPGER